MALVLKDRVKETSTSTGTGNFVLAGASTGFQSFADALADGDTTYYAIEDGTDWETGLGTWTEATSTLARTTVYESSNSGNAVDWGAGTKNVFITQPASRTATIAVYPTIDDLPLTGNVQAGDQAFVSSTNRLYLFNGSGWYNIALINLTPTIDTQPDANYGFDTYGTALTVTLTATDPEGFPLTWSANTTGMTGLATLSQNNNAFTFTPSTNAADQGQSFTATFSVTDGVNTAVSNQTTFTIGIDQLAEPSVGTLTITSPTGEAVFISGLSELWKDASLSIGTNPTNGLNNSTFIDRSTNAHTVAPTGSPIQTAFHPYLENWSVEFDGTGGYLQLADSTDFEFDADFTVEVWVYRTAATSGTYQAIIAGNGSGVNGWSIYLNQSTGQLLWFYSNFPAQNATNVPFNEWTHIAVSRLGSNLYIFKNGELTSTIGSYTANLVNSASGVRIGHDIGANGYWAGNVSGVRIVKGTALYTSNFTPPTEKLTAVSGTALLTCQSNRFIDNSSNAHAITVNGDPKVSAFNPFGQESEYAVGENRGAAYFKNGDVDLLSLSHEVSYDIYDGDYTVEAWVYADSFNTFNYFLSKGGNTTREWAFSYTPTDVRAYWSTSGGGAGDQIIAASTTNNLNEWFHLAFVKSGNTITIYKNGTSIGSGSFTSIFDGSGSVKVSRFLDFTGIAHSHDGYLSDVKITKGTALYTTNFTPPTAPVGNTNASLYLPFDNAGIFDKTGNHTLTVFGDASTSTTQTKFADTAMYFDGSGDRCVVKNIGLSVSPFTIEMWAYPTSPTDQQGALVSQYVGVPAGRWGIARENSTNRFSAFVNGLSVNWTGLGTTPATLNSWYHLCLTRDDSNVFRFFVNGILQDSETITGSMPDASVDIVFGDLGYTANSEYKGYIENLQILKGVAKYTANFTVPDREQGRTYQAES